MATVTDVEVANASFPNVRQDLNNILEALATNFSADAEPTTTYPNQFWYETDTNLLYIRNEADDAWITLASINQTSGEWEPRTGVIQAVDGDGIEFKTDDGVTRVDSAGLALKTDEGTTRVTIADDGSVTINTSLDVDNIKIDGNSITSTDTNGDINITPNGTGKVVLDGLNYPTADGTGGQVLTTDGSGNIAFEDAAAGGITEADIFTLTSSTTAGSVSTVTDLTTNLARESHGSYGRIGTGMSESSGIFTFPTTGVYLVEFLCSFFRSGDGDRAIQATIAFSTDGGSNFSNLNTFGGVVDTGPSNQFGEVIANTFIDVTNTTNVKVKFGFAVFSSTATTLNIAKMKFIRLGDT